jgi:hypothetical protein
VIPQHSAKSVEHPTPAHIVEPARRLLEGIVLDPASCAKFNQRVGAERYFNRKQDGLTQPWRARSVFLNPPGGVLIRRGDRWVARKGKGPGESSMRMWWDKLVTHYEDGQVGSAVFIGFTLEILRTSQKCLVPIQAFMRCYPRERQAFRGDDPTHGNVIVYLPPREGGEGRRWHKRFAEEFGSLGYCEAGGERL